MIIKKCCRTPTNIWKEQREFHLRYYTVNGTDIGLALLHARNGSFCRTSEALITDEIRLFKALAYNLTDAFTKKKVLSGVHH